MKMRLLSIVILSLFAGCATVNVSSKGGVTMAEVSNTCWFLFSFIPLGSGDPDSPNKTQMTLFRNTATLENNMKLLKHAMKSTGAKDVKNITSVSTDEKILILLLRRFTFHTSAELLNEISSAKKDIP